MMASLGHKKRVAFSLFLCYNKRMSIKNIFEVFWPTAVLTFSFWFGYVNGQASERNKQSHVGQTTAIVSNVTSTSHSK